MGKNPFRQPQNSKKVVKKDALHGEKVFPVSIKGGKQLRKEMVDVIETDKEITIKITKESA